MATNVTRSPRADAERNRTRILDSAAELIAGNPDASMVEIAEASGVGRATLYRHFASRDEVVAALRDRAFSRAQNIIADALAAEERAGTAPTARLKRLIRELLTMDDPYGLIADVDPDHHREARVAFDDQVLPLIADAQSQGELTQAVSARAIGYALEGLMLSANRGLTHGELSPEEGVEVVQRGMIRGFGT